MIPAPWVWIEDSITDPVIVGTISGSDPPSHTIPLSVLHHLIGWFGCNRGFSRNTYVGIVLAALTMILVPDKLDMGPSGKRPSSASRYKTHQPTNQQLSTAQTDSVRPEDNRSLPPLHPPTGRDQHSPSYRPTMTCRRDSCHSVCCSWP